MFKSCFSYLGSPGCIDNNTYSKSYELHCQGQNHGQFQGHGASISLDLTHFNTASPSSQSNNFFVRVVHAGGKVDRYPNAILASKLLEKIPGKCLAHPQVFRHPNESLVCPEEYLLPGQKYYVVPLSTIEKLKRKHSKILNPVLNELDEYATSEKKEENSDITRIRTREMIEKHEEQESNFCSAEEFYARKQEKWSRCLVRKVSIKGRVSKKSGRNFPSLPMARNFKGYNWEPSLSSIQEVSL